MSQGGEANGWGRRPVPNMGGLKGRRKRKIPGLVVAEKNCTTRVVTANVLQTNKVDG